MNERLKQFLEMEKLSPARFAEKMGIQRSGLSHLLNGRNNPSFEFIQRMMLSFPDLNAEWLILGKGRPFKSTDSVPTFATEPGKNVLFTEVEENRTTHSDDSVADSQYLRLLFEDSEPSENQKKEEPAVHSTTKGRKQIHRIIVFFTDGSYEEK